MANIKTGQLAILSALLIGSPIFSANADDDAETRIKKLEQMVQQLQQQRSEQDKQLDLLTKELVGIENQVSQSKITKSEEKGTSKGAPVYGAFKDGLVFDDGTGKWSLQINGRIQSDFHNIDPGEWKSDTFSIRRARLGGTFTFLKDFAVRIEGEYANSNDGAKGTTGLTYGYLDYNHFPGARLRIGQFKPIFGLERGESTNFTDFMELSLATATGASFNSTYDRGLMLIGAPLKGTYYNLSYVNGSGQNNDDNDNTKDYIGRVTTNIAEWADLKGSVIHLGVTGSKGSVQSSTSGVAGTSTALSAYTESNGITSNTAAYTGNTATRFFSTAAFTSGESVEKTRLGLETALTTGPVKFQGEYITTNFDGQTTTGRSIDKDIDAWYASLTWLVTGESYADSYKNGMFNRIYPKNNFALDKDGWGAIELGLRYSSFDASDFKLAGCVAGTGCLASNAFTTKANAWTTGAKWILTPNARLMLNYVHTSFDNPITINNKASDNEEAIAMRAQYDF